MNASTWWTETKYIFGIARKDATQILDEFVNLFIEPLLDLVDIEAEREAVDAGIYIIQTNHFSIFKTIIGQ